MLRRSLCCRLRCLGSAIARSTVTTPEDEARIPPTLLQLQPYAASTPSKLRTSAKVWSTPTIHEAWTTLNNEIRSSTIANNDEGYRRNLVDNDLVGLALCTSEAEVEHLLMILPPHLRTQLSSHPTFSTATLEEIFLHVGQEVEARGLTWAFSVDAPSVADLNFILKRVGKFSDDGRGNIGGTLHRISCWRGRRGEVLGVTMRVGRYIPNVASSLLPLVEKGNLLLLSKPGAGKTTMLRDLAATIARLPQRPRVVVIDTSNEIGGDSVIPLPFLGRARRAQVGSRSDQLRIMTEVLQNHSPEYLIVDEIATAAEADAAWSISQRGVRLIATCHGESLARLLQNRELNLLVGGATQAFLSNEERRMRNKVKKSVLERPHSSPFQYVLELSRRGAGFLYTDVNKAVDLVLNEEDAAKHVDICGEIDLSRPIPLSLLAGPAPQVQIKADEDGFIHEEVYPGGGGGGNKYSNSNWGGDRNSNNDRDRGGRRDYKQQGGHDSRSSQRYGSEPEYKKRKVLAEIEDLL